LLVRPENAWRKVDKGPPAEDSAGGKAFREFWGDKSELRRFKDGSITETVVWTQGDSGPSRFAISGTVAEFSLKRHLPSTLLRAAPCGTGLTPLLQGKVDGAYGPAAEIPAGGRDAFQALEGLTKFLVDLDADTLPLRVMSLQPTTTALRGLGAAPLCPHSLAFRDPSLPRAGKNRKGADGKKVGTRVCLCLPAIDAIVNLQDSGKWPEDIEAMRQLSAAVYLRMADAFNGSKGSGAKAIAGKDHLQVLTHGFAFRLRIWNDREVRLLRALGRQPEATIIERNAFHKAQHAASVVATAQRFPALGETVRLAKRWAGSQRLSSALSDEALELLVAHCFLSPLPSAPPGTPLAGLARFLSLLTTLDPAGLGGGLVIDISPDGEPMSDALYRECQDLAESARATNKAALTLATPTDKAGTRWTSDAPSRVALRRACALAAQSLARLSATLAAPEKVRAVMRHPAADYDAEISLASGAGLAATSAFGAGAFANLANQMQGQLLVGLCPIARLVADLRRAYGRFALFFPDEVTGDSIGVVWRPASAVPYKLNVHSASGGFPLQCGGIEGAPDGEVIPDAVGMLLGFKQLGAGLVRSVEVCGGARVPKQAA